MEDESSTPLEELVEARRLEIRINKTELAARAGTNSGHLRKVLTGKANLTSNMKAALDHALEWPHGELNRRLGAAEREHSPPAPSGSSLEAELRQLQKELMDLRSREQQLIDRIDEITHDDDDDESAIA